MVQQPIHKTWLWREGEVLWPRETNELHQKGKKYFFEVRLQKQL